MKGQGIMDNTFKHTVKTSADSTASLTVTYSGHEKCKPSQHWGKGVREQFILHYIVSGSGTYKTPHGEFHLNSGDVFLIRPYTEIEYCADNKSPWEYYWVNFTGTDADYILSRTDFTEENPVMNNCGPDVEKAMTDILLNAGNSRHERIGMTGRLYILLSLLVAESAPPENNISDKKSHRRILRTAKNYINTNYPLQISVDDIAEAAGISRTTLFRIFKDELNLSPIDYLIDCRINQAKKLLSETGLSITAVARSSGYEDNLYFSRVFKKITGCTPTDYRKNALYSCNKNP